MTHFGDGNRRKGHFNLINTRNILVNSHLRVPDGYFYLINSKISKGRSTEIVIPPLMRSNTYGLSNALLKELTGREERSLCEEQDGRLKVLIGAAYILRSIQRCAFQPALAAADAAARKEPPRNGAEVIELLPVTIQRVKRAENSYDIIILYLK